MSVELVNGYVLLPHAPDWNVKPHFRREWRTSIADGVTGAEDRLSFRHAPLRGVEFQILACTLEERRKLVARVLAAKKSGWAAVPLWGRGSVLASPASGDTVTLASETAWEWAADDYAFFSNLDPDAPDAYEVRQIEAAAAAVLTLDQALARTYRHFCWPVIFGRFKCDDLRSLTSYHGSIRISVLERDVRPEPNADLCAIILIGDGGGDNFDCYADDLALNGLAAGSYFGGPWVDDPLFIGIIDDDNFEGYTDGANLNGLAKGLVWSGPWVDDDLFAGLVAEDDFDSYADGISIDGLTAGTGFAGAWNGESLDLAGDGSEELIPGDYRYYRLLISANNGDVNWAGVLELELREEIGGANVATGGTASASREDSGMVASKAFDGLLTSTNGWGANNLNIWPIWLQYDLGAGVTRRVVQYRVGSYSSTNTTAARSSKDWILQGSNDGSNWTTVHPVGNQTSWTFGEMRTYPQ